MKRIVITLTLLSLFSSCAEKLSLEPQNQADYKSVTMVIPPISFDDDPATKVTLDISTLNYLWEQTDSVGIFPDLGSQIYFSMAEGVGQSTAIFDGGGWALKKGSSYYSYFPFVGSYYIDKEAIPISYKGQVQDGNGDMLSTSLETHSYMVAKGVADEATGNLMFTYERLQMPFVFRIPVEAGIYTALDICAGEDLIAVSGTMNAISLDKVINDAVYEDHLTVELKNFNFSTAGTLIVTAVLPPFDLSGKQFTFNLIKSDGSIVTSSVYGKKFILGKAYMNAPNFSVSPASLDIPGNAGTFDIKITGSGNYSVTTDVDWLTVTNAAASGSAVVTISATKGTNKVRTGHVIVSEQVTSGGTAITLQNKVKITQDSTGMGVDQEPWEEGENVEDEI